MFAYTPTRSAVRAALAILRSGTFAAMLSTLACAPAVQVRTSAAPDANLAGRHTFQILPTPAASAGIGALDPSDPMLDNSITNRGVRQDIRAAFEAHGYVPGPNPDFTIAFYATARPRFYVTDWNYGYSWSGWPRDYTEVSEYEQGTVILDVVDPVSKELLWRGRGCRGRVDQSRRVPGES